MGNRDLGRVKQKPHPDDLKKSRYHKCLFVDILVGEDLATRVEKPCGRLMPRSFVVRTLFWVWNHPGESQEHVEEDLKKADLQDFVLRGQQSDVLGVGRGEPSPTSIYNKMT